MVDCCCSCHGVLIDGSKVSPRIRNFLSLSAGKECFPFSQGVLVFAYKGKALRCMGKKCRKNELGYEMLPQHKCDLVVLNFIEAKFLYDRGTLQVHDYWHARSTTLPWFSARNAHEETADAFLSATGLLSAYAYFRKAGWFVEDIQTNRDCIGSFYLRRSMDKSRCRCVVLWASEDTKFIHCNMMKMNAIAIVDIWNPKSEPVVLWLDSSPSFAGKPKIADAVFD